MIGAAHDLIALEKGFAQFQELAQTSASRLQAAEDQRRRLADEAGRLRRERDAATDELAKEKEASSNDRRRLQRAHSDLAIAVAEKRTSDAAIGAAQSEIAALKAEIQAAKAVAELIQSERELEKKKAAEAAVAEYKASAEYKVDVGKECDSFYLAGFAECKKEFADTFPGLDIARVEDPVVLEESESEETSVEEGEVSEPSAEPTEQACGALPDPVVTTSVGAPVVEVVDEDPVAEPDEATAVPVTESSEAGAVAVPTATPETIAAQPPQAIAPIDEPTESPADGDVPGQPIDV